MVIIPVERGAQPDGQNRDDRDEERQLEPGRANRCHHEGKQRGDVGVLFEEHVIQLRARPDALVVRDDARAEFEKAIGENRRVDQREERENHRNRKPEETLSVRENDDGSSYQGMIKHRSLLAMILLSSLNRMKKKPVMMQ